jgi:hypothetical protein
MKFNQPKDTTMNFRKIAVGTLTALAMLAAVPAHAMDTTLRDTDIDFAAYSLLYQILCHKPLPVQAHRRANWIMDNVGEQIVWYRMHAIAKDKNNCMAGTVPGPCTAEISANACPTLEKIVTDGEVLRGPDLRPGHDPGGEGHVPE